MTDTDKPEEKSDDERSSEASVPASVADSESPGTSEGTEPAASPAKPRPARGAWVVAGLAMLVALASAGASAYLWYFGRQSLHRLDGQVAGVSNTVQTQSQHLSSLSQHMSSLSQSVTHLGNAVKAQQQQAQALSQLQSRVGDLSHQVTNLSDLLHSSHRAWELAQIQHLLVVANDRLQLSADVPGAITALGIAQQRLAQTGDPALIPVRQSVSQELQQLRSVQQVDVAGMAITLSTLTKQVPDLPLQRSVPAYFSPQGGQEGNGGGPKQQMAWWQRGLQRVAQALDHMVTIRRNNKPTPALMAPKPEFFLYQNLQLKLESARVALLQRRTKVFNNSLQTALQWLNTYFKADSQAVQSMKQQLGEMENRDLSPKLPDISESLHQLRARIQKLHDASVQQNGGTAQGQAQ